MGRNSRSRQVQKKKKKAAASVPGAGPEGLEESDVAGSLMSMREGMRKVAGTSKEQQQSGVGGGKVLLWIVLAVVLGAIAMMIFR